MSPALAGGFFTTSTTWEAHSSIFSLKKKKKVSDLPLSQGYYKIKLMCLCVLKTPWQNIRCCCWVASVVSDSVRPHRRQPTRLPRPWDSPGKNTGVGCHFLLELGATQIQESLNMNPVVNFQGKGTDAVKRGPCPSSRTSWALLCEPHAPPVCGSSAPLPQLRCQTCSHRVNSVTLRKRISPASATTG